MKEIYENAIKPMLPKNFDENEWFTIAITIIILISIYYITKKNRELLWSEIIGISLFNLQLTTMGDYFLAMPPYDFYDTVDRNSGELMDIFLQNIVYPGTVLIIMHFYKKTSPNKIVFILVGVVILSGLEAIGVYIFHLFTYKSWKFFYSIIFYFFVMTLNVFFFEKLKTILNKRISKRGMSQ
ncbi:hypothetical protein ACQCT5_01715 [Sutcliffiella halmapala]